MQFTRTKRRPKPPRVRGSRVLAARASRGSCGLSLLDSVSLSRVGRLGQLRQSLTRVVHPFGLTARHAPHARFVPPGPGGAR